MIYIILDLEATCWSYKTDRISEIIEIGAVCIGEDKKKNGEFSSFVKPIIHPKLSDFCIELTSISQINIDKADAFPAVAERFINWIKSFNTDYVLCSWGFYDKKQLKADSQLHQINEDWIEPHISLKHQYASITKISRPIGMEGALKKEGIPLTGIHHRGIDDARNIAKIFVQHFHSWKV